jgi:hypothetical protein
LLAGGDLIRHDPDKLARAVIALLRHPVERARHHRPAPKR